MENYLNNYNNNNSNNLNKLKQPTQSQILMNEYILQIELLYKDL